MVADKIEKHQKKLKEQREGARRSSWEGADGDGARTAARPNKRRVKAVEKYGQSYGDLDQILRIEESSHEK